MEGKLRKVLIKLQRKGFKLENKNTAVKETMLTLKNIRDVVILAFFGVLTFKLFSMELSLNIKEFTFTDFLSILVAFFAIGLSIAFYFKATDTSNKFYDNSYAFTREVSEILGRIEAGFGERLKHLDEGYSGIREKFDQFPFDRAKASAELEKEKAEIESKEKEQHDLLEDLAERAKLADAEKEELFTHIKKISEELDEAKRETRRLQRDIEIHSDKNDELFVDYKSYMRDLTKFLIRKKDPYKHPRSPDNGFSKLFEMYRDEIPVRVIISLKENGYVDENGLTQSGLYRIKHSYNRYRMAA